MSCALAVSGARAREESVCVKGIAAIGCRAGALIVFESAGATKLAKAVCLLCCDDTVKGLIAIWLGLDSLSLVGGAAIGTIASFFLGARTG